MAMSANEESQTRGTLSQSSLAAIVVASMVGAGVFTTSGFAIADLGSAHWVMLAWAVGGLIAVCGAISYGQLARLLIDNGGEYLYLSRYVHPAVGFVAGWVSFLAGFTGAGALAAITFESYALPEASRPTWMPEGSLAIGAVLLATAAHAFHTLRGARGHNLLVLIKLLLIGAFIIFAFCTLPRWHGVSADAQTIATPSVFVFATSVMWISLSYCGFNAAIYVAAEAKGGWSDVSGSMVKSAVAITLLYLLLNSIFLYGPPPDSIAGQPNVAEIASRSIGGNSLATLVQVAICLALASSVSSTILAGPRVYAKMAQDGVFPKWFASEVSPPTRSVLLQGIAIAIVVSFSSLQGLLGYLGLTLSLCSAATVGILLFDRHRDFVMTDFGKLFCWAYVLATCVIASLAAWNRPGQTTATIITFLSGILVYYTIVATKRSDRVDDRQLD